MSGIEVIAGSGIFLSDVALVAGGVMSAASAISQGEAARKAARHNAAVAERQAFNARQAASFEEQRHGEQVRKLISSQRAATGASGVALEGSPLLVIAETSEDAKLDALAIRYSGTEAAVMASARAAADRLSARAARTAGFLGAGTSLLLTGGRVIDRVEERERAKRLAQLPGD